MLKNIDSYDIVVESIFGNSAFNIETNPAPIRIAKSSENSTMPMAILMLLFLFKVVSLVGFESFKITILWIRE